MTKNVLNKNRLIWIIYGTVLLIVLAGYLLVHLGPETPYRFPDQNITTINQGWTSAYDGKVYNLPAVLPGPADQPFAISQVLGKAFQNEQFICVRGSLQRVRFLLDDQVFYDNFQNQEGPLYAPKLSIWNMAKIPENSAGKKLTIEYSTDVKSLAGHFAWVYYGSDSAIINYLNRAYGGTLPLVGGIFVLGLVLFLLPAMFKNYRQIELIFLGLFAMTISMWFFSESLLLQFFTGNTWILGGSGCILQSIAPIPLILYVKIAIAQKTRKVFTWMASAFAVNTLLIICLQLFGVMELFESLVISHTVFGIITILTIFCFAYEIFKHQNKKASRFIKALLPFMFFVCLEIFGFYTQNFHKSTHFTKIGLLFFIVVQSLDSLKQMMVLIKKSYQAELYEKLAYEDRLTGSGNRMAFDQAIENKFNHQKPDEIWRLVIFDFNKLKTINDQFGHTSGDEALIVGYNSIREAFKGESCYRIGGDEFACICSIHDEITYRERIKTLKALLEKNSEGLPFSLGVSAGSAVVDYSIDLAFRDLIHRADLKMYENKVIS